MILKALKAAAQSKRASEEEEKEAAAGPPVTRVRIKDRGKMYVEMAASCMCSVCGVGRGEHAAAERPKQFARLPPFFLSLSLRPFSPLSLSLSLCPAPAPLSASLCLYVYIPRYLICGSCFLPSSCIGRNVHATHHNRVYTSPRYTTYLALADALGKAAGMEKVRGC